MMKVRTFQLREIIMRRSRNRHRYIFIEDRVGTKGITSWSAPEYRPRDTAHRSFEVLIDEKLWRFLSWRQLKNLNDRTPRPWIGLLGADSRGLVSMVVKVYAHISDGGCTYMPAISTDIMHQAALKLAARGLSICGMVRLSKIEVGGHDNKGPLLDDWSHEGLRKFYLMTFCLDGVKVETFSSGTVASIHGYRVIHSEEELNRYSKPIKFKGVSYEEEKVYKFGPVEEARRKPSGRIGNTRDVCEVVGTDSDSGAEQADHTSGIPEPSTHPAGLVSAGKQGRGRGRVRTPVRRRRVSDRKSVRGPVDPPPDPSEVIIDVTGDLPRILEDEESPVEDFDLEMLKRGLI